MSSEDERFVLGLDLDGCVADFLGRMKEIFAEWSGQEIADLHPEPSYGFPEWGLNFDEYKRVHRFAVTQRGLFETMTPVSGAPQSLRRLSAEGIRIRIATHRLFISYFHEPAGAQTIRWLESHGIPYWDLCLIEDKSAVRADLFVEDSPKNIAKLQCVGTDVICFSNPSNKSDEVFAPRVKNWVEAEQMIRKHHYEWRTGRGFALPEGPGLPPPDEKVRQPND